MSGVRLGIVPLQTIIKTIKEKDKEIGQEESRLREWNKENNEIGNIWNLYEELWRNPWDKKPWEEGSIMTWPKWLS